MKAFMSDYSYSIFKMFLNQFAISMFGLTLSLATDGMEDKTLLYFTSIFAIVFYLFLIYTMTWEVGSKDKIRHDGGRLKYVPLRGMHMSLIANIPNLILALLFTVGVVFGTEGGRYTYEWAGSIGGVAKLIAMLIQGMYIGVISEINNYPVVFFLITLPAIFVSTVSYILGCKNFKISAVFGLKFPEPKDKNKKTK